MRVLVCGGRKFADKRMLDAALSAIHQERRITLLIQGEAPGADSLAAEWARDHGVAVAGFEANWSLLRHRAGFARNQKMLDIGKPDLVVAFPGGNGTADMVRRATLARVEVVPIAYPQLQASA